MFGKFLSRGLALVAAAVTLTACGYVDGYEAQVHDMEPVYCYRTIGAPECHSAPSYADRRQLVNYFGPHPSRYDAPPVVVLPEPKAPEMVNYWVKDPEPLPRAAPAGDVADRPWLTADGRARQEALSQRIELENSAIGTQALLRRIAGAAAKPNAPAPDETSEAAPVPAAAPVTPVEAGTF